MNNERIRGFLDGVFRPYKQTDELLEQKEELLVHMTDSIRDKMAEGFDFDRAFDETIADLGDIDELVAGFKKKPKRAKHRRSRVHFSIEWSSLPALAVVGYLILGFGFGCWAWGWLIIPVAGIIAYTSFPENIVSLSPFVYIFLGAFFGLWAWGWVIIPLSAILFNVPFIRIHRRSD